MFQINDMHSVSRENYCYCNCAYIQFKRIFNYDIVKKRNIINQICLEMDSLICGEKGRGMDDASGNNTEVNFNCCLQLQLAYRLL